MVSAERMLATQRMPCRAFLQDAAAGAATGSIAKLTAVAGSDILFNCKSIAKER